MKRTIIIVLLTVVVAGGIMTLYLRQRASSQTANNNKQQGESQKWDTKINSQGMVTVVVTPLDLSPQSNEWKFDVGMNTHSVELDQDMMQVAVLVDNQGKEYKPIKWNGPNGGHHREGVLSFSSVTPTPKAIELRITNIEDTVRVFSWTLSK